LIASSHHLEHLGRWDQETVWREMARVLKPGGTMEHIVPSMDWAARKIAEGEVDEHVLNVVVGAQESHGYERQYNTHFFFYTKDIARALAESVGLVDVECEDWRDGRPELGYNLVIRAKKPTVRVYEHQDGRGVDAVVPIAANLSSNMGITLSTTAGLEKFRHDYGACTRPKERVEG
jgi:hypothetical protein